MSEVPGWLERPEQESEVSGTPPEKRAASQVSEGESTEKQAAKEPEEKPATTQPAGKQEFYWRRQAEKLEKELAAVRAEREAEKNRLTREREEAGTRALEAEWKALRLSAIAEAGLPQELAELVPEGPPETVAEYVEKLKPVAEKIVRPAVGGRGVMNTNPPNAAGREEARMERLGSEAARGDRRALREYAYLRERMKRKT